MKMATRESCRAKSAKERRVVYENSRSNDAAREQEFIIGHYLESMHKNDKKRRPKSSKAELTPKMKRFNSQPTLSEEIPRFHVYGGTVAKKSVKEMGPYAWTPLATRTAVGFGIDPYSRSSINARPESAPRFRIRRSGSLSSVDTASSSSLTASLVTSHASSRKRKKSKKSYMNENITLCVRAFANGNRDSSVRVTAKSLVQLLDEATEKLSLPSAGRKIFLPDGTAVTFVHQLYKDCSVYISMGEPFKDPHEALRENEKIRLSSSWTISGIMLPEEKAKIKTKKLSKRMKDLVEAQKYRILVFRNGESREGAEVVSNRFDEFLGDCTMKLGLNSSARTLYDWQGKEIKGFSEGNVVKLTLNGMFYQNPLQTLTSQPIKAIVLEGAKDPGRKLTPPLLVVQAYHNLKVPVIDDTMQTSHGSILGPVWVTKGERFSPSGAHDFLMSVAMDFAQRINDNKKRLEMCEARKNNENVDVPEVMSLTEVEVDREIEEVERAIEKQKINFKKVKSRLKVVEKLHQDETSLGSSYKFQHIAEVGEDSRLVGTKGYRLKLRMNGTHSSDAVLVHFSTKDLRRGKKTQEELLSSFFDMLNMNQSLKEGFVGHGRRAEFRRAFLVNGMEITDIFDLNNDAEVWLSLGEDFIPIEYDVVGFATDKVKLLNLWNQGSFLQRESWVGAEERLGKASLWKATTSLSIDDVDKQVTGETATEEQKLALVQTVTEMRIRKDELFLQNKRNPSLVLYPEVQIIRIGREQDTEFWGEDARHWIFTQDGFIMNKQFLKLVLSVKYQRINLINGEKKIEGFAVGFSEKKISVMLDEKAENGQERGSQMMSSNLLQKWKLTPDGQIISTKFPELCLTNIKELNIEVSQPKTEEVDNEEKPMSSSSSSSNDSGSDESVERGVEKNKKKKKKRKKKSDRKWWNFGSSSSTDSSDDEKGIGTERTKSADNIMVRMKGTSSDDDKSSTVKEQTKESESDVKEVGNVDEAETKGVKTANQLLKELTDVYGGEKISLAVFPKFGEEDSLKIRQRWAIKMEDAASLISSSTLSENWIRQGLAWPVNEADTWVEGVVSGLLLPCAPKLKRKVPNKEKTSNSFYGLPARLKVLKNGENESSRAVVVVGPDLSNMTRKVTVSLPLKWKKSKDDFQAVQAASVEEIEFEQFLDRCTDALDLPFAARRLFDEGGKELTSVNGLKRDQMVYVSSGEAWINPNYTHAEQQRRLLLANLASDVSKIRNYVMLRDQSDFILQVDGPLQAGSRLIVSRKPNESEQLATADSVSSLSFDEYKQENDIRDLQTSFMTSHQIAHMKSEERLQNIRERLKMGDSGMVSDKSTGNDSSEESPFSNPSLARKFSRSLEPTLKPSPNLFRQWSYQDGFIHLKANKKLVIGVQTIDDSSSGQEIVICNKKLEDAMQRWVISDQGFFHLKCNSNLVLTVATPTLQTDPFSEPNDCDGYKCCRVILGRRFDCYHGNSHQMFEIDDANGFINAFSTDIINKEVTSAIKASACTFSVVGSKQICQPGYMVLDGIKPNSGPVCVCESCGKSIRGKLKLRRLSELTDFVCAMGSPEECGLAATGSFKCLTSKVDLSEKEAESTLLVWEKQLKRLQQESSVRVIAYELSLAQTTPSVRIRAYKNGDASYNDGVIVIANSINQFLDLCTYKLGLAKAARKMYTIEGELITDMNQLLQPYYPELCLPMSKTFVDKKNKKSETGWIPSTTKINSDINSANREESPSGSSSASERHVSFADQGLQKPEVEGEKIAEVEKKTTVLRIERMDVRIPVDMWVSSGEPFIPFEESEKRTMRGLQEREERALVAECLEQEKHLLRQIQGRRYAGRSSSQGGEASVKPIMSKTWDQPSKREEVLEKSIEELQVHLSELKVEQEREQFDESSKQRPHSKQRPRSAKIYDRMRDRKLYDLPRGLTVLAFPNGEHVKRAVPVVATNFNEFLDRATSRLDLTSAARRAFTADGIEITDLDQVEKNQLICVTSGEKFVPTTDRRRKIEMRASWSRVHRTGDASPSYNSSRNSEMVLALPAPATSLSTKNNSKIRKYNHEETLHIFDNNNTITSKTTKFSNRTASRPTSASPPNYDAINGRTLSSSMGNNHTTQARSTSDSGKRVLSARPPSAHTRTISASKSANAVKS